MKDLINNIWSENAIQFMRVKHLSQKNVLHPTLAKMINEDNPNNLLDYGCGDGRLLKLLNDKIEIDIFDKNPEMLELSKYNLGDRTNKVFYDIKNLPTLNYEAVLLSMVLVCIDNEIEFNTVLKKIKSVKSVNGKVYIAVTHPCFRDKIFSNFYTSFSENQPFNYLQNGEPFNVTIEDMMPPSVAFTDYHWNLSYTINKIIEAGLVIEKIIETPDDFNNPNNNRLFSPYLIIKAK